MVENVVIIVTTTDATVSPPRTTTHHHGVSHNHIFLAHVFGASCEIKPTKIFTTMFMS